VFSRGYLGVFFLIDFMFCAEFVFVSIKLPELNKRTNEYEVHDNFTG